MRASAVTEDARDALMMEIAAAGDDHKALRKIAAALLAKAGDGDVPAINSLADPCARHI